MAVQLWNAGSGQIVDVANQALAVNTLSDPTLAGYVNLAVGGTELRATDSGHLFTSKDTVILFDQIDGTSINTNIWNSALVSGMTIAQAGGFITLNSGSATTANAYAILKTIKNIPLYPEFPLKVAIKLKFNVIPQSNITIEFGLGDPSDATALTDGVYARLASDGSMKFITNNSGVETSSPAITNVSVNATHDFDFVVDVDDASLSIDDGDDVSLVDPVGISYPVGTTRLPFFIRVINGASTPGTAPQVSIGRMSVLQQILQPNRLHSETLSIIGRGAYQLPISAFSQTPNHANSTSPTSATLSNTAAGYTTLGGRYQFATTSGAATDFALFAFQVPSKYQFFCTAISISAMNTGAAVATTATILDWSIGLNSSAVSLATIDGAGTWAPRRIPLGMHGFIVAAGIGVTSPILRQDFSPALITDSGRYFHVIVQSPVGTATGSQIIRGDVLVTGFFE